MAVIKINNFGGIRPSISSRALPPDAAQTNHNLYLGIPEFRPLDGDATVGSASSGDKTLFRFDSSSSWVTTQDEFSHGRSQINGNETKIVYYSNNTTGDYLYESDSTGGSRRLGVPAPTSLTASVGADEYFNSSSLSQAITTAVLASFAFTEPSVRYSGSTIYHGIYTNPGLYTASDTSNLPTDVTSANQYWNMYAKVPLTRIDELTLVLTDIIAAFTDSTYAYIPLTCMPYGYVENGTALATGLAAITNPRTSAQVLSTTQINAIVAYVARQMDSDENAKSYRTELTEVANEFYELLFGVAAATTTVPDSGTATDPTDTGPALPTVAYFDELTGEVTTEWITYEEDFRQWQLNKEIYTEDKAVTENYNTSITDRVKELQSRAKILTKTIEEIQKSNWYALTKNNDLAQQWVYDEADAGNLDTVDADPLNETRFYLVTFVSDRGEESAPSPPSVELTINQYNTATVNLPTVPSGRNITAWRVYRSATTADLTTFQYVTELSTSTSSFDDDVSNEALGEVIPTVGWDEPVLGLKGLVNMPNGVMAAFIGNTLHFCEPYAPYAWPANYQITTEFPIVGLAVFGQTLLVCTTGSPYYVSGADSASMSAVKLQTNQACVSRRSIATVQGGAIYASPDGLCIADDSGVKLLTQGFYTREDWQALSPSSIIGVEHENYYYAVYSGGCLALDLGTMKLGTVDGLSSATALYVDRYSDTLYAVIGTSIKSIFTTGSRTAVWKSPRTILPSETSFAWLKVIGEQTTGSPVTVNWYANGVLKYSADLTNTNPVRLPFGRDLEHEVEIEAAVRITSVSMVSTTEELQGL